MTIARSAAAGVLAAALSWAGSAAAEPGLGQVVYAPYVSNGLTEFEVRSGRLSGGSADGDQTTVYELEHGFSDRFSLAIVAEVEDEPGEDRKLDAVAVEGMAYLGRIPGLGIDVGLYGEYEQRIHNESGVAEGKLLLAKTQDRFQGLLNLIVEKPLTDRPGEDITEYAYAASATWEVTSSMRLGVEAFGDIGVAGALGGRQPNYIGPVAQWELHPSWLPAELEIGAGYLFAAGSARDYAEGQIRLLVALERRF